MKLFRINHHVNGELAESIIIAKDKACAENQLKASVNNPFQLQDNYNVVEIDINKEQLVLTKYQIDFN